MRAAPDSCANTCWVRSASLADSDVGRASASSYALVCSDWVPPSTAPSAWTATRTTFTSGCCAVSSEPPVWVWKRSLHAASPAPKRSFMSVAQSRRAARNFATSSNRSLKPAKKKDSRGAKSSTSSPASTARRTYSRALAKVKASSCTAVAPASRMW